MGILSMMAPEALLETQHLCREWNIRVEKVQMVENTKIYPLFHVDKRGFLFLWIRLLYAYES